MKEKNIVNKLSLSLNILDFSYVNDFSYFFMWKLQPPKKVNSPYSPTPPIQQKNEGRCTPCTSGISVYCKPTFSEVYTHFDSFLPSTYKFGNVYTLAYRCFRISSSWTKLHTELVCLKYIFLKNSYPENFLNKWFKWFMDNINVIKETTLTIERKPLVLVLTYRGSISLQTRTKLKKSLKNILNFCKK